MPIYTVRIDGKTYDLKGDHPPSEDEARQAIGSRQEAAAPAPAKKGYLESGGMFGEGNIINGVVHAAKAAWNHPVQTGAILGGGLGALATGGLAAALPAAAYGMAAAGAGAAGGAAAGSMVNAALGGENGPHTAGDVAQTMAKEGALGAAGEGAGQAVAKIASAAGRGLYRAAALPVNKFGKYGDLIAKGLDNAVPVSKSGLEKAGTLLDEAAAKKTAALADADQRVALRTRSVTSDAGANLMTYADKMRRAGLPDPGHDVEVRLAAFEKHNPEYMPPSELDSVKSTLDNTTGGAYRKLRMREPLSADEQYGVDMTQAQGRALADVVPGYKDLNRDKMNAEGLRQMIARRVNPNGSGGNQGLENALTMLGGIHAIPARLAMLPPVLSRAGIASHEVGQSPLTADAVRSALLALFGGQ